MPLASPVPDVLHYTVNEVNAMADEVIGIEAAAIQNLSALNRDSFFEAIRLIINLKGRVIVSGVGKSGLIGRKISATLASTGTPSLFLHPTEAIHGDLGMVTAQDAFVTISYSGETDEVLKLVPVIKDLHIPHISISGNLHSTLAKNSDCALNVRVEREACALQLAPTSSTTATLVLGDALAVTLMKLKKFKESDFAQFHPGGNLGRRLLAKVGDEMITENLPLLREDTAIRDTLLTMSAGRLGTGVVLDENDRIAGIITDGDLRRALSNFNEGEFFKLKAGDVMTRHPKTIGAEALVIDAEELMDAGRINALLVEEAGRLKGILYQRKLKYGSF